MRLDRPQQENAMDALKGMLLEQFPEIETVKVFDDPDGFKIKLREDAPVMEVVKSIDDYLQRFILDYGSPQANYYFHITCSGRLLAILKYPGPE